MLHMEETQAAAELIVVYLGHNVRGRGATAFSNILFHAIWVP